MFALLLMSAAFADETDTPPEAEVVVEGSVPSGPDPSATPAIVTVIEVDERLPAGSDLPAVIGSVSGAQVQWLGGLGDWSAVSIRGSSLRQVQVFLDGIPLNPEGASTVNLSELPLSVFERVEVYRGNAPAHFDAAPMGGVINLVTPERPEDGHSAALAYGSFDTAKVFASTALSGTLGALPTDGLLFAEAFRTEGDFTYFDDNATAYSLFDDRLATRENNDKSQFNAHGRVRLGDPDFRVTLLDAFVDRESGVPGTDVNSAESARYAVRRNLAVVSVDRSKSTLCVQGRAWWNVREDSYDDRAGEIGTGSQWDRDTRVMSGALAHLAWGANPHLVPSVTGGVRGDRYVARDLLAGTEDTPIGRSTYTGSVSATAFGWRDRLQAVGVAQGMWIDNRALGELPYEDFPSSAEPHEQSISALNPRGGLLFRPTSALSLKGNVGRYLRTPDFTELFGDRGSIVGNAGLKPERGFQWDAGARVVFDDESPITGSFDAAYFSNVAEDLIVYVQNTQRTMIPTNLGQTWVHGFEAAATLEWFDVVETQSNVTRNFSENLSGQDAYSGNQLPGVPAWEMYQRAAVHCSDRWRLGYTFSFTDGNYWDETNWYLAAPRPIHGLFAKLRTGGERPIELAIDVLNLTDRFVQVVPRDPLNPDDDAVVVDPITDFVGYPLPGRTVLATLRWAG